MTLDTLSKPDQVVDLLDQIENDPDVKQKDLAAQLGVAVGTVNWYLKRLVAKGYVKVKKAQRRKLRYIITPEGIAFRTRLTINYIETSMRLYHKTRQHLLELLSEVHKAGFNHVRIDGEGDIAEICRLTCLEQGISVIEAGSTTSFPAASALLPISSASTSSATAVTKVPVLEVRGMKVHLRVEGNS
jgi:DNA-binding MarR family transcriptional regulator